MKTNPATPPVTVGPRTAQPPIARSVTGPPTTRQPATPPTNRPAARHASITRSWAHPPPDVPTPGLSNPFAVLDGIGLIDARIARRLACDCAIIPVVLGANSEPLDIGRKTRIIPTAIRRALITRDHGCTFPGCTTQPKHCDAHHIVEWTHGGPTALPNLALLCGQHHRLLHHSEWTIRIATDGHPEFIPPTYIDPTRNPRRNPTHPRPG